MTKRLKGRVAIVTGAGGGLGRAHALELARHGARVVVNDLVNNDAGAAARLVAEEIRGGGGEAVVFLGDVTRADEMEAMASCAVEAWGRIDILVNHAGILRDQSFAKMSIDDFRRVLEVHVMGAVHCTRAVWAQMQAQQYGPGRKRKPPCRTQGIGIRRQQGRLAQQQGAAEQNQTQDAKRPAFGAHGVERAGFA